MLTHNYRAISTRTAAPVSPSKSVRKSRKWGWNWKDARPRPVVVIKYPKEQSNG